ncbi:MAG TPA: hypothetical protein VE684_06590, partial [Crenalkalicoccus sp.]|nr:hypothetical protein [Crenalkalicoccus sp.]
MGRPPPPEPNERKNVTLPRSLWAAVAAYRFAERIGTEAEAVRRLLRAGLRAETGQPALQAEPGEGGPPG